MSKTIRNTLFPLVIALLALPVAAQEGPFEFQSDHYRIVSEVSTSHAEETADKMEALIALYNHHFRLPLDELRSPLRVRVFASKVQFEDYLHRLIGTTRNGFVYLHYGDPGKNELIGYVGDEDSLEASIIHQGFIQYLRAFVSNPPLWLREGFAVYFERMTYDAENDHAIYTENLDWLDELRSILDEDQDPQPIPLGAILAMDTEAARANIDVFYPQAWGMVSYFLGSSDRAVNRLMWDTISALEPGADLGDNIRRVREQSFRWYDTELLVEGFIAHVESMRSYRDLVEDGMRAYNTGDLGSAERHFVAASDIDNSAYLPYYYLGLINFDNANFELAEYYYQVALTNGADEALVSYALGVNAYADGRYATAREQLERAIELGGESYQAQARDLIGRIRD